MNVFVFHPAINHQSFENPRKHRLIKGTEFRKSQSLTKWISSYLRKKTRIAQKIRPSSSRLHNSEWVYENKKKEYSLKLSHYVGIRFYNRRGGVTLQP